VEEVARLWSLARSCSLKQRCHDIVSIVSGGQRQRTKGHFDTLVRVEADRREILREVESNQVQLI
jgi:hypothetical protein